ncbi:probable assembly chaperone of rpl4 isoform X1 [Limulus polyphemus]|uniref:Probable assembly chaperone of rpl4 isoform X1 n=1 Tax=Limulus polyphemus TaxID=6850 RepID=A0ABM1S9T7_LIMPO|nr:probable assembly chaperone of rpl4 isoform X1 [Limulus polyphemus]XP_022240392.1 probable assembly chaperone of rpl4 isoform X1 [Limulus polyphemus]XP_022240393.1 probable assembly chaperone of rpl4 isoform X1 [Limulus polyphemus]
MDSENVQALETLSGVLLELGDLEGGHNALLKSVELSPDQGHTKYLSLGQLSEGLQALDYYQRGIDLLSKAVERLSEDQELDHEAVAKMDQSNESITLKRELSNACCAMAEIYMTDCCFEEDAENKCQTLIQKGILADPKNPEALQCMSNFLLVKEEIEEAKAKMQESLSLWLPKYQAVREGRLDSSDFDPVEVCPLSYDARINTSKLLIELELYDEAGEVLEGLVEEDDEVIDTWYLLGWMNYLRGQDYWGNSRFYLNNTKKLTAKFGVDNPQILQHAEELLEEMGPGEDGEDENENEINENSKEEEEFESSSGEEMEH